jgi:hypothetical protein
MGKRTFYVEFVVNAKIELDDQVIDVVDDEWRSQLYNLKTPEQIAEHIAYNMLAYDSNLASLDGWADQPNSNARIIGYPDWDCEECKEIK